MSRVFGGMLMAAGLLIAATTGLCALGFAGLSLYETATGNRDWPSLLFVALFIALGLAVAVFGWWLFRRGLALLRQD